MPCLFVRNVLTGDPADIWRVFGYYGTIDSVTLRHGFAFVNYQCRQEAIDAMESLNFSTFLGRRIEIEWARHQIPPSSVNHNSPNETDDDVDDAEFDDSVSFDTSDASPSRPSSHFRVEKTPELDRIIVETHFDASDISKRLGSQNPALQDPHHVRMPPIGVDPQASCRRHENIFRQGLSIAPALAVLVQS